MLSECMAMAALACVAAEAPIDSVRLMAVRDAGWLLDLPLDPLEANFFLRDLDEKDVPYRRSLVFIGIKEGDSNRESFLPREHSRTGTLRFFNVSDGKFNLQVRVGDPEDRQGNQMVNNWIIGKPAALVEEISARYTDSSTFLEFRFSDGVTGFEESLAKRFNPGLRADEWVKSTIRDVEYGRLSFQVLEYELDSENPELGTGSRVTGDLVLKLAVYYSALLNISLREGKIRDKRFQVDSQGEKSISIKLKEYDGG